MPGIVGDFLYIGSPFCYGMLVKTVVAGLVDDIDNGFVNINELQGGVGHLYLSPLVLYDEVRTVVDRVSRIA